MQRSTTTTGIDFQTDSHTTDIEAYADDGEHAVVWALKRVEDNDGNETDLIEVRTYYWEAGLEDKIGGVDVIEDRRTVSEYARAELLPTAEEALDKCRDYWA